MPRCPRRRRRAAAPRRVPRGLPGRRLRCHNTGPRARGAELGANVWRGDAPEAERGFVALGTPLGHPRFVAAHTDTRLLEEARLLQELPLLPDASPRADHIMRTLPPDPSASYARGHDDAVWRCLLALLGEEDDADPEVAAARRLAMLPARLGGLGLQCAERTPAAYWAAWADALPALRARRPDAAARCLAELAAGPAAAAACLRAAEEAGRARRMAGPPFLAGASQRTGRAAGGGDGSSAGGACGEGAPCSNGRSTVLACSCRVRSPSWIAAGK